MLQKLQTVLVPAEVQAPYATYSAACEVGIQVSVPVEVAAVMGLTVLIITVGRVVSLVQLVVLKHPVDVFSIYLYSNFLACEGCMPLEDA